MGAAPAATRRPNALPRALRNREWATLALLVAILGLSYWKEPRILEPSSINSILLVLPILIVVAIGEFFVLLTRGVDVSVGSMLGLSGIVAGMAFRDFPGLNVWVGALVAIAVGSLLGLVNGLLVAMAKVPPIIATLGALTAYRGLTFIVSQSKQIDPQSIPDALTDWSRVGPLKLGQVTVPWTFVMALFVVLAAWLFFSKTRPGRYLYAIGGHEEAARLSGVPVRRLTLLVYVVCGALSGLGGALYASRYGYVNPADAGQGFELNVLAAVVIGGASILGGSGSSIGVFLGCVLLATIKQALSVLGIDATWQLVAFGSIIMAALLFDGWLRRRMEGAR